MSMPDSSGNKRRPPRKKACNSCTKSKVRCSLEKPTCSRCQLTGRTCAYPASVSGRESPQAEVRSATDPGASYSSVSHLAAPDLQSAPEVQIPGPYAPTPASTVWSPSSQIQRPVVSASQEKRKLDFTAVNLVPSADAENIRDRWLRPYILPPLGQDQIPKVYHPFTLQYISQILSTYPRCMLKDGGIPPIIHSAQVEAGQMPKELANCYSLVRMWVQAAPGSEVMVVNTLKTEMERLVQERPEHDYELLAAFQAYLIYAILIYFSPLGDCAPMTDEIVISLMEMAFRTARNGLTCAAELEHTRPTWESWIVVAAKRRAIITMYLFSSVYNADRLLPDFIADEMKDVHAPGNKTLWIANDRETWGKEYERYLLGWEDGMLEISELWKSEKTGSTEQRARIERWLRAVDEFGMMLFGVCAHVHGC